MAMIIRSFLKVNSSIMFFECLLIVNCLFTFVILQLVLRVILCYGSKDIVKNSINITSFPRIFRKHTGIYKIGYRLATELSWSQARVSEQSCFRIHRSLHRIIVCLIVCLDCFITSYVCACYTSNVFI